MEVSHSSLSDLAPLAGAERTAALVEQLASMQTRGTPKYPNGLFPAQRYYPYLPFARDDDGIFLTAQIALLLRDLLHRLPNGARAHAGRIVSRVRPTIPQYRHRDGTPLYNFWRTKKGTRGH